MNYSDEQLQVALNSVLDPHLDLIVFKVDHGLCVLLRTPTGYGVMFDVGCSSSFSPSEWLSKQKQLEFLSRKGYKLAWLIVSHPHDDHVEDVSRMISLVPPAILLRHSEYDWNVILNPKDGDPSENAKKYYEWQKKYSGGVSEYPDLGLTFERFALSPQASALLGGQTQNIVNNSSYVCVFTWKTWKVVVCGDNEEKGLEALLLKPGFREAIKGANVLVTPHHGHASGYSCEFMKAIGSPLTAVSSAPTKDQHVDDRYTAACRGLKCGSTVRKHFTTRTDGHFWLRMNEGNTYQFCDVQPIANPFATSFGIFN